MPGRGRYGDPVLALTRCSVAEPEHAAFLSAAREVLAALAGRPGFRRGQLGRSLDDPALWVIATEWEDVGSYRRGLSAYDVKVAFAPLMALVVDEPSAHEVVLQVGTAAPVPAAGE